MVQRRKVIIGAVGTAAGLAVAGCSGGSKGSKDSINPVAGTWQSSGSAAPGASGDPAAASIQLTVSPVASKTSVSPADPVTVAVQGGTLKSVVVATGMKTVAGAMQDDGTWKSTGSLTYSKTYTVTASVTDSTGAQVSKTSSFTTVKPTQVASTTFQANGLAVLTSGGTYGIGQPVIVAFSHAVHNKTAAEQAIQITTTPSVEGKFFWLTDDIVHWRPEKYWAKGTKVEVSVNSLGLDLGNGTYGGSNRSTSFTIGRSLIAISDNNNHHTKVYVDGALVRTMASSNGKGGYTTGSKGQKLEFWTHNGVHVVLNKQMNYSMSSASYGVTNTKDPFYYAPENVQYCTRISYSGEFLHAAPWNHELGRANISHGCVNLGVADAMWVYATFIPGDLVVVQNSPIPLPVSDGLGDWNVPYTSYGA